ncbi:MAG: hypothetical protein DRI75_06880 [Bacteroidetes bacterium]|nr:MAG: hypothetical protein DRI75_06880 [Bacteroidota bacterium]
MVTPTSIIPSRKMTACISWLPNILISGCPTKRVEKIAINTANAENQRCFSREDVKRDIYLILSFICV